MEKSDSALIQDVLAGSLQGFDELMIRYQGLVYHVARGYSGSHEHALDVTQNVFLKAYSNLRNLREDSSFKAWLVQITCRESINWLRQNKRFQGHESESVLERFTDGSPTQEDRLIGSNRERIIARSLRTLNPRHRTALILRYFEGLSIREIAGTMGCSEGLVKNMLFRSIQKLRVKMNGDFDETMRRI